MNWIPWAAWSVFAALAVAVFLSRRRLAAKSAALDEAHRRLDISAQREADVTLTADRYRTVISEARLGILVMDENGGVVETNRLAEEFLRARHGAALAEAKIQQLAARALFEGEVAEEFDVRTPAPRSLRVTALPTSGGVVAYVEDISERKQVDAARTDFVANVSHELKTPLGALSLLAETLDTTDDPGVRSRLIARLGEQATRMSRLVDDILDLSLVEAADLEPAVVDLHKVIVAAAAGVTDIATATGVSLTVAEATEDMRVVGDERQLISAVSNLLSNAIAYTAEAAEPRAVTARAYSTNDSSVVEVKDTGIGIPLSHRQRIFERFYVVDRARDRQTGGTGLGLAIVRHVARNHGGSVEVESESGVGSMFRIRIPHGGAS